MSYFPEIFKNNLRFLINRISDSKKELEIRLISDNPSDYTTGQFELTTEIGAGAETTPQAINSVSFYQNLNTILNEHINSNNFDVVMPAGNGTYVPLVNANYSTDQSLSINDPNYNFFVIRLNKSLPPSFKKLDSINLLILQSEIVKNEIQYAGKSEEKLVKFGNPLDIDYAVSSEDVEYTPYDTLQSKNQLTSSIPQNRLNYFISSSVYNDNLVDYRNFETFIYFS